MLTLHVEAPTLIELAQKVVQVIDMKVLRLAEAIDKSEPAPPIGDSHGVKIIDGLKDAVAHAQDLPSSVAIDVVGDSQRAAAADAKFNVASGELAEAPQAKPRGRPRKNAQPAVAENTGSTAVATSPVTPPVTVEAEPAAAVSAAPEQASVPASALTHDLVKAKLQDVMHAAKDQNTGMAAAYEIVKKYGYTHVRDIKPEHFAAIFADAQKVFA